MATQTPELTLDPNSSPRRGAYPIPLSSTSTAGFIGRTQRGPVDEPVCLESFPEYLRYFGGHLADGAVSHAVQDFFLHGGRRAVVVRVANRATRARLELPGKDGILRFEARYPGRHEVLRASIDYERVEDEPEHFNLVLQRVSSGAQGSYLVEDQEIYPLVSTVPSETRFLSKVLRDSRLVSLVGPVPESRPFATPPDRPGEPVRYVPLTAPGHDGGELTDYDIIGSNRYGTGLFAFARGPRIDLLAIPLPPHADLGTTALIAAARFCEASRALLIWDPPREWQSADSAMLGSRRLQFRSNSVMTYFPRIRPRGTSARQQDGLPACGAIAGMLARRDQRGLFGRDEDSDYILRAALAPILSVDTRDAQRLARSGINAFMSMTGGAVRLVGRVTLAAGGIGRRSGSSLDRRRLGNFILNSIDDAVAAAVDAEGETALEYVEKQLDRFFDELYQHGALKGLTPQQAYYLRVQPARGSGGAELRFGLALSRAAEFSEYAIVVDADKAIRLQAGQRIEADQLFS